MNICWARVKGEVIKKLHENYIVSSNFDTEIKIF